MIIDEQILKRIRDLGALGHTPTQISCLLDISINDRDVFIDEFSRPETRVYSAYQKGKSIIGYNTNVELARQSEAGDVEAITLLAERNEKQKVSELLAELFGI